MAFIWPVVVAWGWGGGWLNYKIKDTPMLDIGGTITVFLFAASFAFAGAIISGRRIGRYDQLTDHYFCIENYVVYVLGATLTILGIWGITVSMAPTDSARGLAAVNS